MTVVYSVVEHPLLSPKVKGASEELLAEYTALAAQLLGVDETEYTGDDLKKIERAIVLQMNYWALVKPELFIYSSEASSHSKQSVTYRNVISLIFPMSQALVNGVVSGSGWDNIKAIR